MTKLFKAATQVQIHENLENMSQILHLKMPIVIYSAQNLIFWELIMMKFVINLFYHHILIQKSYFTVII